MGMFDSSYWDQPFDFSKLTALPMPDAPVLPNVRVPGSIPAAVAAPSGSGMAPQVKPVAGPPAVPTPGPTGAGDPYMDLMQRYADLQKTMTDQTTRRGAELEKFMGEADKIRSGVLDNSWLEPIAQVAKGFAMMRPAYTAGAFMTGNMPQDPTKPIDDFIRGNRQDRILKKQEAEQKIANMREYMAMKNAVDDNALRVGELGLKAGEVGIQKQQRGEDVDFRNRNLAAENARHAESMAVQREGQANQLRIADAQRAAQAAAKVKEVATKYGDDIGKDLQDQLNRLESDDLYKGANTVRNSSDNVVKLIEQGGSLGQIYALIQGARAAGDSGVLSNPDMDRYIAGSLSTIQKYINKFGVEATGVLPEEVVRDMKASMGVLGGKAEAVINDRRQLYRDGFEQSQTQKFSRYQDIYCQTTSGTGPLAT